MEPSLDYGIMEWAVLVIAAFIIGFSKTGMPGAGILSISLIALVIPARASTGLILPMLIAGDVFAVAFYRRHADWRHLIHLMPWAFVGIVIGYFMLAAVTDGQLRPMIGIVILVLLGLNELRERWKAKEGDAGEGSLPANPSFAAGMGILGGAVTMLANAAGPIISIYMLAMRLPKTIFVGTGAWYFLVMNCVKVPFSANLGLVNKGSLLMNLALLPVIIAGAILGLLVLKKLPEKSFNRLVVILSALAALKLIF